MSAEAHASHAPQDEAGILRIALNLGAAGMLAGVILATVNYFTQPIRLENERIAQENARKTVLPAAETFQVIEGLNGWFYGLDAKGNSVGYVLPVVQRGYDGNIHMTLGVDKAFSVVDYKILKDRETPGLGAKAKEPFFRERFKGKTKDQLDVDKVPVEGKILAITGATITSRAIANGIKSNLETLEKLASEDFKNIPAEMKKGGGTHE